MEAFTRNALLTRAAAAAGCALAPGVFPSKTRAAPAWPSASAYTAEVPLRWFELALELVRRTAGFSPPVASRALGYAGVTLYEALAPGMPGCRSLAGSTERARPATRPRGRRAPLADGREPGACLHPAEPVPDCGGGERGGD
jgi:hypothetical protein